MNECYIFVLMAKNGRFFPKYRNVRSTLSLYDKNMCGCGVCNVHERLFGIKNTQNIKLLKCALVGVVREKNCPESMVKILL